MQSKNHIKHIIKTRKNYDCAVIEYIAYRILSIAEKSIKCKTDLRSVRYIIGIAFECGLYYYGYWMDWLPYAMPQNVYP
jgi:hypothetical protein